MFATVLIKTTTKGKQPSLPFRLLRPMKDKVLGSSYELSVVFCGTKRIRTLNRIYRQKDKATDILSFPLTKNSGEIFICLEKVKSKARQFDRPLQNHFIFLVIHGLLHLKGMVHGSRMESKEKEFFHIFSNLKIINGKENSGRN